MTISLVVIFGLLAVGWVVVAYGTAAKKRWGINLEPLSCPRCSTLLPRMREPRSLRQALWGGWTCPVCGAGVDRCGREVAPIAPRTIVKPEGEMRRALKKRLILALPLCFCLMLLLDWTGVTDGGFPSTWGQALFQIGANIAWTVFFAVSLYLAMPYLLGRFFSAGKERDPGREHESDRTGEA
jgi:hypothetical protein